MNDGDEQDPIELKPLQFSLRWVLIAMGAMAVLFAMLAPWLRQFSPQLIGILAVIWIVAVVIFAGIQLLGARYYGQARLDAGAVWIVLERAGHRFQRIFFLVVAVLQVIGVGVFTLTLSEVLYPAGSDPDLESARSVSPAESFLPQFLGLYALLLWTISFSLSGTLLFMMRSRQAALCESGLMHVAMFVPWRKILSDRWQARGDDWRLVFKARFWRSFKLLVPQAERAEVEGILDRVRPAYSSQSGAEAPSQRDNGPPDESTDPID